MKIGCNLVLIIFLSWNISAFAENNNQSHKDEIKAVIEAFRLSIINKDKETFKALFHSNNIPFIAVFTDEMLNEKRKIKPDYPRTVNLGQFGPPVKMISDSE